MNNRAPLFLTTLLLFLTASILSAQQGIQGTVTDELGEPIIGGNVKILHEEVFITGTATDFEGNYSINLDPGVYNIEFSYVGYNTLAIQNVAVVEQSLMDLSVNFDSPAPIIELSHGCIFRSNPIDVEETTQGMIISGREIRRVSKSN